MNSLKIVNKRICHYGSQHFGYDKLSHVSQQIQQDLADSNLTADDLKFRTVIVDFRGEGQCNKIVHALIYSLIQDFEATPVVVFNAQVTGNVDYRYLCLPAWMTVHCDWFQASKFFELPGQVTHKFLCLMRRPSASRADLAIKLLDTVSSLQISFGSMCESHELSAYQPRFLDHELPLLIDGLVKGEKQHHTAQPVFAQCLFNIVVESSAQHDTGVWHSKFITEKTFKAFALQQIPVWWAVPGLVDQVRILGFDLFDDIVDHAYDRVEDQQQRLDLVVNQVQRLNRTFDLTQCNNLRSQLASRLQRNFDLLQHLAKQQSRIYDQFVSSL
jgi:hypothetical protein